MTPREEFDAWLSKQPSSTIERYDTDPTFRVLIDCIVLGGQSSFDVILTAAQMIESLQSLANNHIEINK